MAKMTNWLRKAIESSKVQPLEVREDVAMVHINASAGYAQVESYRDSNSALIERLRPRTRLAIDSAKLVEIGPDVWLRAHTVQEKGGSVFNFQIWLAPTSEDTAHIAAGVFFSRPSPICSGRFTNVKDLDRDYALGWESAVAWSFLVWSDTPLYFNDPGMVKN